MNTGICFEQKILQPLHRYLFHSTRNKLKRALPYITLIFILGIVMQTTVFGQRIKGMAIAGGSLTQVEGDEVKGWDQFGFTGGLGAILPFAKNWDVNLETLFSQKGSYQKKQVDGDSLTGEYRLRLNYFEIPLYVTYTDKDVMSFGLGGYYGFLVSDREREHSGNQTPYTETVPFNSSDWGFLVDARVRIWKHLHLSVRYTQSLMSIRERTFPNGDVRKQKNQAITLRFIYIFNEPK